MFSSIKKAGKFMTDTNTRKYGIASVIIGTSVIVAAIITAALLRKRADKKQLFCLQVRWQH